MSKRDIKNTGPVRNGLSVPVMLNVAIVAISALLLWSAAHYFEEQTRAVSMVESRFVTAEWHLLRELKQETDRRLAVKDREIELLRLRYRELIRQGASGQELQAIEDQLRHEQAERDTILAFGLDTSMRLLDPAASELPAAERSDPPLRADSVETPRSAMMRRLDGTADELARTLLRNTVLEEELILLRHENAKLAEQLAQLQAESVVQTLIDDLQDLNERLAAEFPPVAAAAVEEQVLELVHTRNLMRAVIASPEIRAEYPGLLNEMERYFEAFGDQHSLRGRREAYAAASRAIETVAREIKLELRTEAAGDSAEGYLERLLSLVEQALAAGVPQL